jgi:signal-transduction protein with cAMP-binding, CBS, and nucleotidyltransferase domain
MLRRVLLGTKDPVTTRVSQIMTAPLIVGESKMNIQDAVTLMIEKKIKKLPILEDGRLVGLITLTDLVRSIAYLKQVFSNVPNNVSVC